MILCDMAARHPTKCDEINEIKLFAIVYRRIYCRKFLTLSNTEASALKCEITNSKYKNIINITN